MPSGKYSADNPAYDMIPLEGVFVSSFLAEAPAVFVKVYIYCLYMCQHTELSLNTPLQLSKAIGCSQEELLSALEYWSNLQLINFSSRPLTIELCSAFFAAKQNSTYTDPLLSVYKDYFATLRAFFPERSLSPTDYDKAKDWLEVYGLPQEVALMLVSHCIVSLTDKKVTFNYIDKVARSWADENIKTVEAAEEYIQLYEARHHNAAMLLVHFGIKRTPTMDEINMYDKWTNKMGFTDKAIIAACKETTKTANPSFSYLDKILGSLNELGLHDAKAIKAYLDASESENKLVALILHELGLRGKSSTPELLLWINRFLQAGFNADGLVFVARSCARDAIRSFKNYCQRLLWWQEKRIFSPIDMEKYLKENPDTRYTQITPPKAQFKQTNAHIYDKHEDIDFSKLYTDLDSLEDLV